MDDTSNPSSSSSSPPSSWDVFLSFFGKDTRAGFIAHLYEALDQAGIQTFRDDPALEKGDEISPALFKAIRSSNKFVVVLSENYAYSAWCLNELVEIFFCKKTKNQVVVIPVFYYVNPTDVRYQKESFEKAIDYHYRKKRYSDDMIEKWKSALAEIGDLSGYHLKKDAHENEAHTIQKIVEDVAPPKVLHLDDYLFGIDSAVETIHLKLKMDSNDVRAILIWGMGGIGKTTTAKAFFNKYSNKFDASCFIENAKQYSLLSLLEQLLIELLKKKDYKVPNVESGIKKLQQILSSDKSLIILDDLDQLELLEKLHNSFSPGSRIIITARDASLQNKLKLYIAEVDVYEVKVLGENKSLELFSYHAFRKTVPPEYLRELSKRFVTYAGGLPLALKVLGSSLRGRTDVSFWKAHLEKVRVNPEIHGILKLSYDELVYETDKDIFLDIAFFFVGKDKEDVVHIFNSCGFLPDAGIPILVERCLLTIDKNNKFQMHNLIQDMGRELGMSKGLFWRGNEWEDLQDLEQKNKIEGVILDLSASRERQMNAEIFKGMRKVRLLQIIGSQHIKGNFDSSFRELRCIRWSTCPWTSLPSDFRPRKLVSIDMPYNNFNTLWNDATPPVSLKTIDLSYSQNLRTTPDFRDLKTAEKLLLRGCKKLLEVHPSIGQLTNLGDLDLSGCENLKQLPDSIAHLKELVELKLDWCEKLNKLPEQLGDMEGLKMLDASFTQIQQLPDSIGRLTNLVYLKLVCCQNLTTLPNSICKLKLLKVLDLSKCYELKRLPEQLGKMKSLEMLNAASTLIEELPDSIVLLSKLQDLNLYGCWKLEYLPDSIGLLSSLQELNLTWCTKLEYLPDSIGLLSSLQELDLSWCDKLEYLPNSLRNLTSFQNYNIWKAKFKEI